MAIARSKKKAKSGSKAKSKAKQVAPKKVVKKPAPKKKAAPKVKKPAPKATKPAPKKVAPKAKKPAPKKVAVKAPAPQVSPAVGRALAQADVEGLMNRLPPPVQPVVKTLRKLVLEAAPEASEMLEDGSPAYFANGVFARIEPREREVLVRFLKGDQLPSASELTGDAITLTSVAELKDSVLRKLVREAVMLNLSMPKPT